MVCLSFGRSLRARALFVVIRQRDSGETVQISTISSFHSPLLSILFFVFMGGRSYMAGLGLPHFVPVSGLSSFEPGSPVKTLNYVVAALCLHENFYIFSLVTHIHSPRGTHTYLFHFHSVQHKNSSSSRLLLLYRPFV